MPCSCIEDRLETQIECRIISVPDLASGLSAIPTCLQIHLIYPQSHQRFFGVGCGSNVECVQNLRSGFTAEILWQCQSEGMCTRISAILQNTYPAGSTISSEPAHAPRSVCGYIDPSCGWMDSATILTGHQATAYRQIWE